MLLLALPAASGLRARLSDNDLWWHLAAGEWMARHGAVPWTDPFSYTAAGRPWIAYSWLPEVVFHAVSASFGFAALRWLGAAVLVAVVGASYATCRVAGARPIVAVIASALGSLAGTGGWSVRPQALSFLFLALVLCAAYGAERSLAKRAAPLVVALWANSHIAFVLGPAVLALAAAGAALERRRDRALEWAALVSFAAPLVNPYGWNLFTHAATMSAQPAVARAVEEFRSPDLATLPGVFFALCLTVAVVLTAASRRRPTTLEAASFAGSLALALWTQKNMAYFGVCAAPVIARSLESLWPIRETAESPTRVGLAMVHWLVALALAAGLLVAAPRERGWRESIEPDQFPVAAADFVAAHYPGRRLFNDFDWGGFLIFRLYPQTLVSIDGRTQVYGPELLEEYERAHFALEGWNRFFQRCDPEVVIWPREGPFASLMHRRAGWQVAYEDDVAVVFTREGVS